MASPLQRFLGAAGTLFAVGAAKAVSPLEVWTSLGTTQTGPTRGTTSLLQVFDAHPVVRAITARVAADVASTRFLLLGATSRSAREAIARLRATPALERRAEVKALRRQGELVEIEEHPFLRLWEQGNPFHTGYDLRWLLQLYLDLVGEAFLIPEENAFRVPSEVRIVPPSWVAKSPGMEKGSGFTILWNGRSTDYETEEVWWLKHSKPSDPYARGSSTTRALSDEIETDELIAKFDKAFFFSGARPDVLFWAKRFQGGVRETKRDWMRNLQGWARMRQPHFLEADELQIHEFGKSLKDLMVHPLRDQLREIMRQAFGVPPEILGDSKDSNRATISAADYLYQRLTILPRLEFQQRWFQTRVIPLYDEGIFLEFENPVSEDADVQLKAGALAPWVATRDEYRELMGLEPAGDESGKLVAVPFNVTLEVLDGKTAAGEKTIRRRGAPRQRTTAELLRVAERLSPKARRIFLEAVAHAQERVDLTALENALKSGQVAEVERLLGLEDLETDLLELGPILIAALLAAAGLTAQEAIAVLALEGFALDEASAAILAFSEQQPRAVAQALAQGSAGPAREVAREVIEGLTAPDAAARLIRDGLGMNGPQTDQVLAFRARLLGEGVSGEELERRVQDLIRQKINERARTIALHETFDAAAAGRVETWRQLQQQGFLPADQRSRWVTRPGLSETGPCAICGPMDGQEQVLGQLFVSPFNGSTALRSPIHVLCVCDQELVF